MKYKQEHIDLMDNVVVPLASEDDADKTATELSYFDPEHVTAVFVAEETTGYPNKTPNSVSENIAGDIRDMMESHFPETDFRLVQSPDVTEGIISVAEEVEASAIVFRPRQSSVITRLLSGNKTMKLLTHSAYPVVALPDPEEME